VTILIPLYYRKATITRVVDGDTVEANIDLGYDVHIEGQQGVIRLYGMNAPESRTKDPVEKAAGLKAKTRMSELVAGKTLAMKTRKSKDEKYGRFLAELFFIVKENPDGTMELDPVTVNQIMVDEKLAVPYFGEKRT